MRRFILISMLSALSLISAPFLLVGQNVRTLKAENAKFREENAMLSARVDSLRGALLSAKLALDSVRAATCVPDTAFDISLSDSLLHVWYMSQEHIVEMTSVMECERFTSSVSDDEFCRRLAALNSRVPLQFNGIVKNYCIMYSEKMPAAMSGIMGMSRYYWPLFDSIFTEAGIPLELKALAVVESMLKADATSRVGAKGLWQFMYGTGRGYGLRIDSWMDERMDPVKSTMAAARYLRDAYETFGNWNLAIASYNCGAGNITKAIRRSGGKTDFWEIYDFLPRETRSYVPAFIGALYATRYYREYGIVPDCKVIPVHVDTLHVHRNLHFAQISECTGISVEQLAALNPQYIFNILPGNDRKCVLRLPSEYIGPFISASDTLYEHNKDKYLSETEIKKIKESAGNGNRIIHIVKSGDVLGRIAARYGVTVAQIKKWNSLKSDRIRIGQKLVIYRRR